MMSAAAQLELLLTLGVAVLLDDEVGVVVPLWDAVLDGVWLDDCEAVPEALSLAV